MEALPPRYDAAGDRYFFTIVFTASGAQKYNEMIEKAKTRCSDLSEIIGMSATYTLHDGFES